jgi:hypothetical protein
MDVHKAIRLFVVVAFVLSTPFLSNCELPCGDDSEPRIQIQFYSKDATVPARSYYTATESSTKSSFNPYVNSFELPLALNSDQLTYIFKNDTRSDTLTISYKRVFEFESIKCGYRVSIKDVKTIKPTTFSKIEISPYYGGYYYSQSLYLAIYD